MPSEDLEAWSTRIYSGLPNTGFATSYEILTWLRGNPHKLNGAFGTSYVTSGSGIDPTITPNHSGVYEEMFYCNLWERMATKFLGVDGYDLVESEVDGQGRQRFVSRNERAKTFRFLSKDCYERLLALIDDVSSAESTDPIVAQILFSDRANMVNGAGYCPAEGLFSNHNTVFSTYYTYRP